MRDPVKYPPHNADHLSPEENEAYAVADQIWDEAQNDPGWSYMVETAAGIRDEDYDEDDEDAVDPLDDAATWQAEWLRDWGRANGLIPENDDAFMSAVENALVEYALEGLN